MHETADARQAGVWDLISDYSSVKYTALYIKPYACTNMCSLLRADARDTGKLVVVRGAVPHRSSVIAHMRHAHGCGPSGGGGARRQLRDRVLAAALQYIPQLLPTLI